MRRWLEVGIVAAAAAVIAASWKDLERYIKIRQM